MGQGCGESLRVICLAPSCSVLLWQGFTKEKEHGERLAEGNDVGGGTWGAKVGAHRTKRYSFYRRNTFTDYDFVLHNRRSRNRR